MIVSSHHRWQRKSVGSIFAVGAEARGRRNRKKCPNSPAAAFLAGPPQLSGRGSKAIRSEAVQGVPCRRLFEGGDNGRLLTVPDSRRAPRPSRRTGRPGGKASRQSLRCGNCLCCSIWKAVGARFIRLTELRIQHRLTLGFPQIRSSQSREKSALPTLTKITIGKVHFKCAGNSTSSSLAQIPPRTNATGSCPVLRLADGYTASGSDPRQVMNPWEKRRCA